MIKGERPTKIFKSVMEDKPPNPFLMLFALPVALFCVVVNYLNEKFNK
jgi:hypothetical protein